MNASKVYSLYFTLLDAERKGVILPGEGVFGQNDAKNKTGSLMMNINEPEITGTGFGAAPVPLICSSFFLHAKEAGAHKSSPAKAKEKGCSCESSTVHKITPHRMI